MHPALPPTRRMTLQPVPPTTQQRQPWIVHHCHHPQCPPSPFQRRLRRLSCQPRTSMDRCTLRPLVTSLPKCRPPWSASRLPCSTHRGSWTTRRRRKPRRTGPNCEFAWVRLWVRACVEEWLTVALHRLREKTEEEERAQKAAAVQERLMLKHSIIRARLMAKQVERVVASASAAPC